MVTESLLLENHSVTMDTLALKTSPYLDHFPESVTIRITSAETDWQILPLHQRLP